MVLLLVMIYCVGLACVCVDGSNRLSTGQLAAKLIVRFEYTKATPAT